MRVQEEIRVAHERAHELLTQWYPCKHCVLQPACERLNGCLQSPAYMIGVKHD